MEIPSPKQELYSIMLEANIKPVTNGNHWNKLLNNITVIVISLLAVTFVYNAFRSYQSGYLPEGTTVISQATLEQKYGLRVNLVAVTAAGGLVDVRLKIIDGDKAKTLLSNPKNFPALMADKGIILRAAQDFTKQEIKFDKDSNLFIMFSNPQNLVTPGTPVTILFGNTALKAQPAK